ncbi:MAG: geranylgeranylglycerol-phosphate geranylgeranyltransferase [Thermoplasmata archaeon]|nr:geranylgeranylglycerol-phosphate geranylgeranyltransferase [Thermoplasmata archaeon]MCI4359470.1 geranylgeranylglycerol-phosphate geranylgeranyltransferase [Thermoplasmata archaeon]
MGPYLTLVRIGNVAVSFAGTVIGGLAAKGVGLSVPVTTLGVVVLAGLSTACVTAGGNILNDLGDRDSDRANHPDRPLVTGAVSVRSARRLAVTLVILSFVGIVPIVVGAPLLLPILVSAWLALYAYEYAWKARGLPGNAMVAYLTAAVFLYGGAGVGNLLVVVPFAAMAFGATLSREVIKDMEDASGDVDRRTLPRTRGMGVASRVARTAAGFAIVLSPVPLVTFLHLTSGGGIIYLALVLAVDVLFVVSVAWLPGRLHREQTVSKAAMTVALLAFLAAAFR